MLKKIILISLAVLNTTACVSSKIHKELDKKYNQLKSDYDTLSLTNDIEIGLKKELKNELNALKQTYETVKSERDQLKSDLNSLKKNYDNLKSSYSEFEQNSYGYLDENLKNNLDIL